MDIEFMIQDTFALVRPNWTVHSSLEEAAKAFQEATAKIWKPVEGKAAAEVEAEADEESSSDERGPEEEDGISDDEMDVDVETQTIASTGKPDAKEDDDSSSDSEDERSESEADDEGLVVSKAEEVKDPEAEAEFDREFAKIMAESLESRKFERKTVFDVPLPIKKAPTAPAANAYEDDSSEDKPPPKPSGLMSFSLLTKKGNKQQVYRLVTCAFSCAILM